MTPAFVSRKLSQSPPTLYLPNHHVWVSLFIPPPPPKTGLGRYRVLSSRAGVRVSPTQLGAMSIGDFWNDSMRSMDKDVSFKLLDAYYDAGGNFIDTANSCQDETSEQFVGEWAEQRGIRDQLVLATKCTTSCKQATQITIKANHTGNNVKSMRISVDTALEKLRTSYMVIFYVY